MPAQLPPDLGTLPGPGAPRLQETQVAKGEPSTLMSSVPQAPGAPALPAPPGPARAAPPAAQPGPQRRRLPPAPYQGPQRSSRLPQPPASPTGRRSGSTRGPQSRGARGRPGQAGGPREGVSRTGLPAPPSGLRGKLHLPWGRGARKAREPAWTPGPPATSPPPRSPRTPGLLATSTRTRFRHAGATRPAEVHAWKPVGWQRSPP